MSKDLVEIHWYRSDQHSPRPVGVSRNLRDIMRGIEPDEYCRDVLGGRNYYDGRNRTDPVLIRQPRKVNY